MDQLLILLFNTLGKGANKFKCKLFPQGGGEGEGEEEESQHGLVGCGGSSVSAAAVAAAGGDDSHRRLVFQHVAHLHR